MKINVGDWALVGSGKKAHKMIQGYNGLAKRCTPFSHGGWYDSECADYEQEDLKEAGNADRCKRCEAA
jgi:hypothetical protein